jgi:hypothetical protein
MLKLPEGCKAGVDELSTVERREFAVMKRHIKTGDRMRLKSAGVL